MTQACFPPNGPKGRGAKSNDSGRFEAFTRHDFNDGWDREDDDPPRLKTELQVEKARKIVTENDSPDIGFNKSINPYRGCEHGCVYPPVTRSFRGAGQVRPAKRRRRLVPTSASTRDTVFRRSRRSNCGSTLTVRFACLPHTAPGEWRYG